VGKQTGIEWTEKTWNPWQGCTKVSPGCAHCYAEREHLKYKLPDFSTVRRSKTTFDAPLKWKEPARIFTCSWSDFFHEAADAWRAEAWEIIRQTPHHTYQILTKRPELMWSRLPADWGKGWPHVWLGVSAENQRQADARVPELCRTRAALRFVSCEPLLGPVDLTSCFDPKFGTCLETDALDGKDIHRDDDDQWTRTGKVGWVIAGGESGAGARPMDEAWARALRDQCAAAHVPFFLKQLGGHPNARAHDKAVLDGQRYTEVPNG
jgi:protein gp37